jgi:two-component system response regulator AtoC
MTIEKILIADDEPLIRNFLRDALIRKNYEVFVAENGEVAATLLQKESFDLVFTDMKMPFKDGLHVLKCAKKENPSTLVIIMTAYGTIENAVDAIRLGAFNYLIKPFSLEAIEALLQKAEEHISLVKENHYLREEISGTASQKHARIIAHSPAMQKIWDDIEKIAKSSASVFISGESGTGKEVLAQAIHFFSLRTKHPFITVNCAAIPDTLVESEFFGHEKGAFTGALARRIGRFELAHKGTLLLDEVTEIPIQLQAKLLRAIQEQEFERVGSEKPIKVDVRIISTSNRSMQEAIEGKSFREDLYYRLNVMPIHIPPLRERSEDILPLAEYFLEKFCRENHKPKKSLQPSAQKKLLDYSWPGNVRELANIIERTVVLDLGEEIADHHLYLNASQTKTASKEEKEKSSSLPVGIPLHEMEKRLIQETLEENKFNKTKTAKVLGISLRTLRNKLQQYAK